MSFKPYHVYHIFNQGNNREPIFFLERNYYFFLEKMRRHLLPNVHLLAYCLMPNHFHWLVCVKPIGCELSTMVKPSSKIESDHEDRYQQNLSAGIALLLRSYTRAINVQQGRSGSLFRQRTKCHDGEVNLSVAQLMHRDAGEDDGSHAKIPYLKANYWQRCFDYIHQNPVDAGMTDFSFDWEFSSAAAYFFGAKQSICDMALSQEMGLYDRVQTLVWSN
jgi:putative transposase